MFPEYKDSIPKQISCIPCRDLNMFYLSIRHDYYTADFFSEELNQALELLIQLYQYLNRDLLPILSSLLEAQPISVVAFPQIMLLGAGTLVKPVPVTRYKKLVNIKTSLPSLNAVSYSLCDDLDTGNDEALFKKIDRLQNSKHPVFYDFFTFITSGWGLVINMYSQRHHKSLPDCSLLRDKFGYFDSSKFEELLDDEQFLMDCVIKLITQPLTNQRKKDPYLFGLQLTLKGRVDVMAYVLNEKLHPFDAVFLKFILPDSIKDSLNWVEWSPNVYFQLLISRLETLSNNNYQKHINPMEFTRLYQTMMDSYHVFMNTDSECQVHFFPKTSNPLLRHGLSDEQVRTERKQYKEVQHVWWGSFEHILIPLMGYLMRLFIQVPYVKLATHKGRLGPILRTMFPGEKFEILTLPLNDNEKRTATQLLLSPEENSFNTSLQVYHLGGLSLFQTYVANGMHLFMEGFLQVNSKLDSNGRVIYLGSHNVYQLSQIGANAKAGFAVQVEEILNTSLLWNRIFGFSLRRWHPSYSSIAGIPYCHGSLFGKPYSFQLTPNSSVLKQDKCGLRFYPVAFEDKGLYCHLNEGANILIKETDNTQYIASGCCLLGNDFVATVETAEGKKTYHLLDVHQEVPKGSIVDVSFQNLEHPEEAMYLTIQRTLAPFYRSAYQNTKIIFYFHDLRMDYLFYLLPHYIKGTLSLKLLLKAIGIINDRHQAMISKMKAIFSPYAIECSALSALNSLKVDNLLNHIEFLKRNTSPNTIEIALTSYILHFLTQDSSVPEQAKRVYTHVLTHQQTLEKLVQQQGLHFIAVVDYLAQFALINLLAQSPVLVALPSVEYKLLKSYEIGFAQVFGSVIHFLWLNPINLRDDKKHNRLFFIDKDIPQFCALIDAAAAPLQRMIGHHALDNPKGVVREWNSLKRILTSFPSFFANDKPGDNLTTLSVDSKDTGENTVINTLELI